GDLMWRREDGMFVFAGRRGDRIRIRGENVSPAEVESHLASISGVTDCAVVGIDADPDEAAFGEQEILTAIVPDPLVETDFIEIFHRCASVLPHVAVPRYFCWYDELPRTPATQRIQRNRISDTPFESLWDAHANHLDRKGKPACQDRVSR